MIHREESSLLAGGSYRNLEQLRTNGLAVTVRMDGEVLACLGAIIPWAGLAEIWIMTSPLVTKYPKTFHKTAKQLFQRLSSMKLKRVQATISSLHPDQVACTSWAVRFGFRHDGIAKKYGPQGEDHVRLVYFPGE